MGAERFHRRAAAPHDVGNPGDFIDRRLDLIALLVKLSKDSRDLLNRPHPDRIRQSTRLHQRQNILRRDHHILRGVHDVLHLSDRGIVNATHLAGRDNAGDPNCDSV